MSTFVKIGLAKERAANGHRLARTLAAHWQCCATHWPFAGRNGNFPCPWLLAGFLTSKPQTIRHNEMTTISVQFKVRVSPHRAPHFCGRELLFLGPLGQASVRAGPIDSGRSRKSCRKSGGKSRGPLATTSAVGAPITLGTVAPSARSPKFRHQ